MLQKMRFDCFVQDITATKHILHIQTGKVNCVSALRNISLLKKFEAKLGTSTPKFVYLFFFWVFFLNIGRSVTGLFVVAKGLLFMTS